MQCPAITAPAPDGDHAPKNATYSEAFNGRLRAELLDAHCYLNLIEAQTGLERWRKSYRGPAAQLSGKPLSFPDPGGLVKPGERRTGCPAPARGSSRRKTHPARSALRIRCERPLDRLVPKASLPHDTLDLLDPLRQHGTPAHPNACFMVLILLVPIDQELSSHPARRRPRPGSEPRRSPRTMHLFSAACLFHLRARTRDGRERPDIPQRRGGRGRGKRGSAMAKSGRVHGEPSKGGPERVFSSPISGRPRRSPPPGP